MNYEHKPNSRVIKLPVYVHNLVENGIFIVESMDLEALDVPLRIGGGTGSPVRPLAIV